MPNGGYFRKFQACNLEKNYCSTKLIREMQFIAKLIPCIFYLVGQELAIGYWNYTITAAAEVCFDAENIDDPCFSEANFC
jgi:hypothetical protein